MGGVGVRFRHRGRKRKKKFSNYKKKRGLYGNGVGGESWLGVLSGFGRVGRIGGDFKEQKKSWERNLPGGMN